MMENWTILQIYACFIPRHSPYNCVGELNEIKKQSNLLTIGDEMENHRKNR